MKMLYLLAGVAALALASAAYAQAQKDPKATETNSSSQQPYGTSDPAAASSPAQRDSTSVKAPETSTGGSPEGELRLESASAGRRLAQGRVRRERQREAR